MDGEKQKFEILALQSIYNKEEFSYHEEDGHYHCTFKIFLNLPSGYYVSYKDIRHPDEEARKVQISHLPPLCLYTVLPENYPSLSMPKFTLCTSWLQHRELALLCKKLDKLWEENRDQEILFTWITFLQDETLEYLKIQQCLNMDYAFTRYTVASENAQSSQKRKDFEKQKIYDRRAISDCPININPIQDLIIYNDKRIQIQFRKNYYCCKICFTIKQGAQSTQFQPCGHIFCKECITGYLQVRIDEGNVLNIYCPEEKCSSEATPGQIKLLVDPELFSKYDSLLLSIALNTMGDIIYCPRPHCQYPASREANEEIATCPACQYAFCVYCKSTYHGIEPCKVTDVSQLVQEYQAGSECRKKELEKRYGKKIHTLMQNFMSESWISSNSRKCPSCQVAIEKSEGCCKMMCWRCNTFFCWMCNAKLNRLHPYSHYENPESKCYNKLFDVPPDEEDDGEDFEFPFFEVMEFDYFE